MVCNYKIALLLILWGLIMLAGASKRPLAFVVRKQASIARRASIAANHGRILVIKKLTHVGHCLQQNIGSSCKFSFHTKPFSGSGSFSSLGTAENELEPDTSIDIDDDDDDDEELTIASGSESVTTYQPGIPKGFFIVDHDSTPSHGFDMEKVEEILGSREIDRLKLNAHNVTLPVALMLMDPETYPSLSRARKTCRKGYVLVHRGPLSDEDIFEPEKCIRGRVGDRVFAGDVIAQQVRMGNGWYNAQYHEKPPFDLPVVYEDDHFALINKPAGIVTYSHRSAGHGRMSVKAALPFYVKAPKPGTFSIISRPIACHRLDKPTSGLVCSC